MNVHQNVKYLLRVQWVRVNCPPLDLVSLSLSLLFNSTSNRACLQQPKNRIRFCHYMFCIQYPAKMHEYNNILLFQKLADLYIEGQSGIANMNVINIARWSVYYCRLHGATVLGAYLGQNPKLCSGGRAELTV